MGWFEYTRALALLDPLLNSVNEAELQVIEQIVKDRDEFAVYTNLSRRLEAAPSSLSELESQGPVERRGLAWMMALARVELGAMAAGFTEHPRPFAMIAPSQYEAPAYLELLLDGARTHVLALRNDPAAQYYASMRGRSVTVREAVYGPSGQGTPQTAAANEQRALAYARRVVVADEFIKAAAKFGAGALSPSQQSELASYREPLRGLEDVLIYKVLGVGSSSSSTTQTATRFNACPRLIQIAQEDIAAGRATIEPLDRQPSPAPATNNN
ncbi:MAG: hypothetical protein KY475_14005 [Planctomycetes bacterium]|nr:hypothetical protein [Planctomycetota bacterium]